MKVSSTELQNNFGKYLMLAAREDIIITRNGMEIAKLSPFSYPRNCLYGRLTLPSAKRFLWPQVTFSEMLLLSSWLKFNKPKFPSKLA